MGRLIALLTVGLALVRARPAAAQASPDPGSDRRGSYVRIAAGAGYSSGEYRFSGVSAPWVQPATFLKFDTTLHGAHAEFAAAFGHEAAPGLAVAGYGIARIAPVMSSKRLSATEATAVFLADLGALVDFYPLPLSQWHFIGGAGWSAGVFPYSDNDIANPDNIVEPEEVSGPHLQGGAGYRFTPRFDLLVRASYAWLESGQSRYRPLGATVLASWLHF